MRRPFGGVGLVLVLAAVACACASAAPRTLSDRFVRQGTPSVDLGGPRPAPMKPADRNAMSRSLKVSNAEVVTGNSLESNDPALRQALAMLGRSPTSEHYLDVADAYMRHGVFDRAHDYLTRSLSINGPSTTVYDALARLWRDWGQPGEALAHAHRAVYLAPRSPVAHNTLGTILYRLGRTDDARASFVRAAEADPTAWYAFANLCHINMAAGDTRTAIAQCHKAAALKKAAHASE